jgi:hypothetical protein
MAFAPNPRARLLLVAHRSGEPGVVSDRCDPRRLRESTGRCARGATPRRSQRPSGRNTSALPVRSRRSARPPERPAPADGHRPRELAAASPSRQRAAPFARPGRRVRHATPSSSVPVSSTSSTMIAISAVSRGRSPRACCSSTFPALLAAAPFRRSRTPASPRVICLVGSSKALRTTVARPPLSAAVLARLCATASPRSGKDHGAAGFTSRYGPVARTPPKGALDAGLRHRAFPPDAASLLPGLLTATRTGPSPAGECEPIFRSGQRTATPPNSGHTDPGLV